MTKFLKNIKKSLPAAFLAAIILILASLTGLNSNTVSGDLLGCENGICEVVLICNDGNCNAKRDGFAVDGPLRNHLENTLGHTVTYKDDNDGYTYGPTYDPTDFDVVVISDSADSPKINWLKDKAVGILTVDALPSVWSNRLCLASGGIDDKPPLGSITVTDNTHYITQEFGLSPPDLHVGGGEDLSGGVMEGWGGGVQSLAHYPGKPASSTLLAVDEGGTLVSFGTGACQSAGSAAGRRVFFGARLFQNLNAGGREVFDRAFEWAAGLDGAGGGAASSGWLESSTFDTGVTGGAAFNSIMWQGTLESGGIVKFQVATANCSNGATDPPTCTTSIGWGGKASGDGAFMGPGGSSAAYYQSGPGVPTAISTLDHNNKRYFRYKIFLEKSSGATSPVVNDVIINWSP